MSRRPSAFTLVELLVSMTILTLMLTILLQMTNQTSRTWRAGAAKAEQFSESRKAFETMTQRIASATLNTYWDYAYDPNVVANPQSAKTIAQSAVVTDYVRQSDLRFRVLQMNADAPEKPDGIYLRPTHGIFFQASFGAVDDTKQLAGLSSLLNSWGYFVEVGDTNYRTNNQLPSFLQGTLPPRYRSRLMEFSQPAEEFTLYSDLSKRLTGQGKTSYPNRDPVMTGAKVDPTDDKWFTDPINGRSVGGSASGVAARPVRVLAENVIALIIRPRLTPEDEQQRVTANYSPVALTPDFRYHSKQTTNYTQNPPLPQQIAQNPLNYGGINPKNQVPPVVQVAMFAIDEVSAATLQRTAADPLTLDLKIMLGMNDPSPLFIDSTHLETSPTQTNGGDLQAFEQALIGRKLSYRLFTTNIALKSSKWSSMTTK